MTFHHPIRPPRPPRPFRHCGPWDQHGSVTAQLAAGIVIMAFGLVLALDRLQLLDAESVLRYWPLVLIAIGGAILGRQRDAHGRFWGFGWMFVGAWLLLNTLDIVRVGFWQLIWPLLLVLVGISLIRQAMGRSPIPFRRGTTAGTGDVSLFAMWSQSRSNVDSGVLRRGSMTSLMGGCVLDARHATMPPEGAVLDVFAIMGGVEVRVPAEWTVVTDVASVMAGIDDKRRPVATPAVPGHATPRLVIRGVVVMGGLMIKD